MHEDYHTTTVVKSYVLWKENAGHTYILRTDGLREVEPVLLVWRAKLNNKWEKKINF